ncbi:MAG: hypothetical protein AB2A00_21555 [Myxococcota bacterium]
MVRINGSGISTHNPFGPSWARGAGETKSVGEQIQDTLFGKPKPKVLDQDDADVAAQMARLHVYRKRLARLAGDNEDDYSLILSEGTIAMIDQHGAIYVGKSFLLDNATRPGVLVGVLAHEIGHRPKRWAAYRQERKLSQEEHDRLCRTEETRADYFSGVALAELGMDCEPLVAFLMKVATQPHPEYFSAELRASVIREAHGDGKRKADNRKKFFPEFARMTSAKGDLGTG